MSDERVAAVVAEAAQHLALLGLPSPDGLDGHYRATVAHEAGCPSRHLTVVEREPFRRVECIATLRWVEK